MPRVDDQWAARLDRLRALTASLESEPPAGGDDARRALVTSLFGFYEGLTDWGTADPAEAGSLRGRIRTDAVGGSLQGRAVQSSVLAHIWEIQKFAERGRYDGYKPACRLRSALQLLLEDFGTAELIGADARVELDDADDELRDAAEEAPPLHRCEIPSWAPKTHWWWWQPKRTDMSMREYRERVYAADLEGFDSSAPGAADWLRCGDQECWCATAPPL